MAERRSSFRLDTTGTRSWRPFTWVILGINVLLAWATFAEGSGESEALTGLAFAINLFVWAAIDVILLTLWMVTNPAAPDFNDANYRDKALRTWAKRCAYCQELIQRDAAACPRCCYIQPGYEPDD